MNGPSNWENVSQDCCSLQGVTCDTDSGRVTDLALSGIAGQFNESLCELSALGSV
jgi:hypothetical protein